MCTYALPQAPKKITMYDAIFRTVISVTLARPYYNNTRALQNYQRAEMTQSIETKYRLFCHKKMTPYWKQSALS